MTSRSYAQEISELIDTDPQRAKDEVRKLLVSVNDIAVTMTCETEDGEALDTAYQELVGLCFGKYRQTTKKIIHVNQHNIKHNGKHGTDLPVLTVKAGSTNTYCHEIEIQGSSKMKYSPDKALSCGAKVWMETDAPVVLKTKATTL